jgi:hypothetical protein
MWFNWTHLRVWKLPEGGRNTLLTSQLTVRMRYST